MGETIALLRPCPFLAAKENEDFAWVHPPFGGSDKHLSQRLLKRIGIEQRIGIPLIDVEQVAK